jgi:hypothetical protein
MPPPQQKLIAAGHIQHLVRSITFGLIARRPPGKLRSSREEAEKRDAKAPEQCNAGKSRKA